jgi:hypothetical protein
LSVGWRRLWKAEKNGETRFRKIVLEMGLTEALYPYGKFQGIAYYISFQWDIFCNERSFKEILTKMVFSTKFFFSCASTCHSS